MSLDNGWDWLLSDLRGPVREGTWTDGTFPVSPSNDQLVAEYEGGETARGLARKYELHRSTVVRRLRKSGMATGQRKLADDESLVSRVCELREEGWSVRMIGRKVGVSHQSVLRLLTTV